ncbi:OLC1v1020116C3 [Oldenlandia corymbosa var. corymbosa]|nr:OLC1v1020116C3 [Oldenlandia corymbosa var. corymbosa]
MTMAVLGGGLLNPIPKSSSFFVSSSSSPSSSSSAVISFNRRPTPPIPCYSNSFITNGVGEGRRRFVRFSVPNFSSTIAYCFQRRTVGGGFFPAAFSSTTTGVRNANTDTATPAKQQQGEEVQENEEEEDEEVKLKKIKEAANSLDIRVGKILVAYKHPEADSLYVEEVDVGEPEPRIICSGLVNYIPINDLQHRYVVVLANLKPRNMRGVRSYGMLMAASDAEHENVELLVPPENSVPGERIWFGSEDEKETLLEAASPNQVQKKKIWELVQPHLKTDESCIAGLGLETMRTAGGVVVTKSLKNARIS